MTSASEPRPAAARRARDRWRRHATATAEASTDLTIETRQDDPGAPRAVAAEPQKRTKTRGGFGEFVRNNLRVVSAAILFVVGVLLVILGWYGAAYTNILTEQIPYLISGGLLGVALIIVAGFLASSASLERENRDLRRDLMRALGSIGTAGPGAYATADGSNDGRVFSVAGGQSYHVAGCPIIEGKDAREVSLKDALKAGLGTCKLCGPD